jgi:hypothetical protein
MLRTPVYPISEFSFDEICASPFFDFFLVLSPGRLFLLGLIVPTAPVSS